MTLRINPKRMRNLTQEARDQGSAVTNTLALTLNANVTEPHRTKGSLDLDAYVFAVQGAPGCCRAISSEYLVYYDQKTTLGNLITYAHMTDEPGLKDQFNLKVNQLPPNISGIIALLNIYAGRRRSQSFAMVKDATITISNLDGDTLGTKCLEEPFGDGNERATTIVIGGLFLDESRRELLYYQMNRGYAQSLTYVLEEFGIQL